MSIIYLPIQSAYGQNIKPFDGALLYVYEAGTTTLKTVYSDKAETVALTNPVVADASGRWAAMFISGLYKLVCKDKDGTTIWTEDNLQGRTGDLVWGGNFSSSTNSSNYPASGNQGDWYVVTTGFTLATASGGYVLNARDFIIANKDGATGIDADWDIIRGKNIPKTSDISYKNLVAKYVTTETVDVDIDSITLVDTNNYPVTVNDVDLTATMPTDLHAGTELASTWYQIWLAANIAGTIIARLVPDIAGTADGTTAGVLEDSTNEFFLNGVKAGDIVYNTTDNTKTTVKTTPTVDGANLEVNDDIFVDTESYTIHLLSPTFPSGYTFKGNIGAVYNDSGSDFDTFHQIDNRISSVQSAVLSAGTASTPTAIDLSTVAPITATVVVGWTQQVEANGATAEVFLTPTATVNLGKQSFGFDSNTATLDPTLKTGYTINLIEPQKYYYDLISGDSTYFFITGYEY